MTKRNPFAYRKDANHDELKEFFVNRGATVDDMARIGGGIPDLTVTYKFITFRVEVKSKRGRLNEDQRLWFLEHEDTLAFVVRSIEEGVDILEAIDDGWLISQGGYYVS